MKLQTMEDNKILQIARDGARLEARAVACVENQIDDSVINVARLIDQARGKVIVVGSGTSGTIARRLAHLLSVSGTPGVFVHPMDALHGTMGAIEGDDVLIALSKGGESDEINSLCSLLSEQGTTIIGIGEQSESTLARLSDVFVCLHTADGADPENVLAMGSTLVTAIWGDALARVLMAMHGWTVDESIRIHPAGAVGKNAICSQHEG
ncbi:SIS domain-containing protein [Schaalia sp. ZJ405]|uniref:KpsF/GutQ family sugar-phosphate isomerase n=1 Tax=Schaalia sp. ZJ405 TaxID=2709403 RepID=UPI0013EBED3B|nr:SIS domain-containing protein [Schaalia sp. ZJ405]QPK81747.1 SIS domain-containing protein [Schaalia sp. ZJ405]